MVLAVCKQCGKGFSVRPSRLAEGKGLYCSRRCFFDAKRRYSFAKTCACCGKIFYTKRDDARFCSRKCAGSMAVQGRSDASRSDGAHRPSAYPQGATYFFEDPWASGAIGPDQYGRDLYRMPDAVLGF